MKKFDVDSWARKPSYEVFRNYADPSFHITANVDVTRLYNDCKINGDSFFSGFFVLYDEGGKRNS